MPTQGVARGHVRAKRNPLIDLGIERIDYKDSALLRRFISDRGKIRSRRVTGLTVQQQRRMAVAIRNAREMAFLPYPGLPGGLHY